jgi:hypothetical protein
MSSPCYHYSTTAVARTSYLLAVLGGLDHVVESVRFPSHSAFVAAPGCADESRSKFPDRRALPRSKNPGHLDSPAPPLWTLWDYLDISCMVGAGDDGDRRSSQETSQSRPRGRGVASVAVNFYDRSRGTGGDTCIGCKRGSRCIHTGIESPLSHRQRRRFGTQNEHSWAYEWSATLVT